MPAPPPSSAERAGSGFSWAAMQRRRMIRRAMDKTMPALDARLRKLLGLKEASRADDR